MTMAITILSPLVEAPGAQALSTGHAGGTEAVSVATAAAPKAASGPVASRFARVAPDAITSQSAAVTPSVASVVVTTRRSGNGGGSCGTNWPSHKTPPDTIGVLRTKTGKVQTVDFRTYVATVMASGEFPTWLPPAVLEVGATAVKQYAWYYAMEGHHRSGYKTASGDCYDVMDDTNDQLFHPEWADPTQKQLDAVAATWGLTLRKDDRFFLTGYRYGASVACAKDADGWHLYEQSIQACAAKGWSRQQIQEAYYAPHVSFVWSDDSVSAGGAGKDRTAPVVIAPSVQLRTSVVLGGLVGTVSWSASDSGTGVAAFTLQRSLNGKAWQEVALASSTTQTADVLLGPDSTYRFRVKARDGAGNTSAWAAGATVTPHLLQAAVATLTGSWTAAHDAAASGRSTRYSRSAGARAKLTFRGRSIAIVAPTGPQLGIARVFLDGKAVGRLDLQTDARQERGLVWSHSWSALGKHSLRIEVLGVKGHPRVDLDAFVILR
jgi:hypothetical protein